MIVTPQVYPNSSKPIISVNNTSKFRTGITNLLSVFDAVILDVNWCLEHVGISVLSESQRLPLLNGQLLAQLNVLDHCNFNSTVVFCEKLLLVHVVNVFNDCLSRADAADIELEVKINLSMKLK